MPKKGKKGKKGGGEPDSFGLSSDGLRGEIRGPEDLVSLLKERTLLDRVAQLELQNKHLLARNQDLKSGLSETTSEQADVYIYLHKKLDENFSVIASLEEKLESLEDENERLKKLAKKEIAAAAAENETRLGEMQREIERLNQDLLALEAFRSQREATHAEIDRLKTELEEEKKGRQLEVAELERRNVAAKDKLKKEMFAKIKETKRSILAATADQLHHTTKRTMAENEQITTELTYQSKETEKVMAANKRLTAQNGELRRKLELLEQAQEEFVKRAHFFQKLVKKLHEKLRLAEERERVLKDTGSGASHHAVVEMEQLVVQLHRQVSDLTTEKEAAVVDAERSRKRVVELEAASQHVQSLQDDTLKFLLAAMEDLRKQASKPLVSEPSLHGMSAGERMKAVDLLLARMQLFEAAVTSNPYRQQASTGVMSEGKLGEDDSSTKFPPIRPSSRGGLGGIGGGGAGSGPSPTGGLGLGLHPPSSPSLHEPRPPSVPSGTSLPVDRTSQARRQLIPTQKPLSASRRVPGPVSSALSPSAPRERMAGDIDLAVGPSSPET